MTIYTIRIPYNNSGERGYTTHIITVKMKVFVNFAGLFLITRIDFAQDFNIKLCFKLENRKTNFILVNLKHFIFTLSEKSSESFANDQVWYFVTKIVLTYCEKKLF